MQAFIKTAPGVGNMVVGDAPVPVPQPGEALVQVARSGVCGTELLVHDDVYRGRKRPMPFPLIVGHEASGVLVELGPNTTGPRPGARVALEGVSGCGACFHCTRGSYNLCQDWHHIGLTRAGALAEFVTMPVSSLIPIPDDVSFESAAMLEPFSNAVHTLERLKPAPGQPAAIIGPGPLGLLNLQVLRAAGASPILVLGRRGDEPRLQLARALGADVAVVADRAAARDHVAELTDGLGMAIAVEAGGTSEAVQTALDIVASNGSLVTLGLARSTEIDALTVVRKNLVWLGVVAAVRRHYAEAIRLIQSGKVELERLITHRMPLADAAAAVPAMRRGDAVKMMFVPGT
ncbi:MAG TPA: alcohol dehydrogenase catalytic domain-containing protein [Methylomirabilota bacterium]|jgi:2-desacetyl-2-hydroxyethyl bacteriochlorophyllide A dehydrogenase